MTRHADHAAKIIAAARIRRESGRRGGKDDHLADCRDGQTGNDQGTPSQQIPIVNREPRPTTAATQPVPRPNALPPSRRACRIAGSRTGGRPYRLVMHGSPPRWSAPDGSTCWRTPAHRCGTAPVRSRQWRRRHPPVGAPVVMGRRRGGGVTNLVEAAARNSPARLRSARRRSAGCGSRDVPGLLPPGAARLRCPGERNGACRWLRPVGKSSDALIRAVRMSRGRGRRSRGAAGCRTRWPGSRIWR